MSMKNSNYTIGNKTCDLPTCSVVPQPTALPRAAKSISIDIDMYFGLEKCARICLKKGRVQSKIYMGSTLEKDIKELNPREVH
jgi:hypothetical protein